MTKSRSKPKAAIRSTAQKRAKPASRKQSAPVSSKPGARTKHDRIIAMLRTPAGATIASLVTANGSSIRCVVFLPVSSARNSASTLSPNKRTRVGSIV